MDFLDIYCHVYTLPRNIYKAKKNYLIRNVNKEHQDILDAVLARDVISAQKNLVKHYNVTGKHFLDK